MFQKVFEYAGPHKKGLYAATAIVLVSVLLGVFPFVLAYQVIAPLVMGEAITASVIIKQLMTRCSACGRLCKNGLKNCRWVLFRTKALAP